MVSKSSAEVEYCSMSLTNNEVIWLCRLLCEFGVLVLGPTPLFTDNTSTISIVTNPVFHERIKYIEVDIHFIQEKVAWGTLHLPHVSSYYHLANLFANAMTKSRHDFLVSSPHQFEGECKDYQKHMCRPDSPFHHMWQVDSSFHICRADSPLTQHSICAFCTHTYIASICIHRFDCN